MKDADMYWVGVGVGEFRVDVKKDGFYPGDQEGVVERLRSQLAAKAQVSEAVASGKWTRFQTETISKEGNTSFFYAVRVTSAGLCIAVVNFPSAEVQYYGKEIEAALSSIDFPDDSPIATAVGDEPSSISPPPINSGIASPLEEKAQSASPVRGFLKAIGFNVVLFSFIYCFWADRGPYQWLAAVQYNLIDSYSKALTLLVMVAIFMPPGLYFGGTIGKHGRWARLIAFIPGLSFVAGHFMLTIYFIITGGSAIPGTSLDKAVSSVTFLPQAVTIETSQFQMLDRTHSTHIASGRSKNYGPPTYDGSHYIPFMEGVSQDPNFPVVFESGGYFLEILSEEDFVQGIIYKSPLPYPLRRNWGSDKLFGTIIVNRQSVREYWSSFGYLYGVFLFGWLIAYLPRIPGRTKKS